MTHREEAILVFDLNSGSCMSVMASAENAESTGVYVVVLYSVGRPSYPCIYSFGRLDGKCSYCSYVVNGRKG